MVMKWPPKYGRIYDHKGWATNWHLPKALPTSEQQSHWLSSSMEIVLLQLLTFNTSWGVQGGVRHSVLQGIWWDRSLDSWMVLGTYFIISILASPHILRSIKSLHGDIRPSSLTKNPFVNWVLHGIELPLHQNFVYWLSSTAALEQSLRAIWDAVSWAAVLVLPQIKWNSQLLSCTSFF